MPDKFTQRGARNWQYDQHKVRLKATEEAATALLCVNQHGDAKKCEVLFFSPPSGQKKCEIRNISSALPLCSLT